MILRSLQLQPFAGFVRKEIRFEPGLNVILGPNDAGKSTIFRAIDCGFFLPSRLSRSTKEGRDLLPRLLPLGSDRASVALEFAVQGELYRLEKCWGAGAASRLGLPGGGEISAEEKIEERLASCLPAPAATMQGVLFMGQNALEGTVADLAKKRESLHSLGDVLRVAVDQTGGVSVERLKSALAKRLADSFRFWDKNTNLPEKGRGIEDPWKKNLGTIVDSYYQRETARREWEKARALENRRDLCLSSLQELQQKREGLREFVRVNAPFVESASARQLLEEKAGKARLDGEAMARDLKAWIQGESDRRLFGPEVERLEKAKAALDEEMKLALLQAKKKALVARFEKVKGAQASLQEARKAFAETPALKAEELRQLRAASQEVDSLKTGLKAGKIQLQFTVKRELELSFRKDLDPERKGTMAAGKSMTVNAGGRILLESELFSLQVTSGEGNLRETEEQLAARTDALGKLLARLGVQTLEEAQARHEKWMEAGSAVKAAESALAALLGGERLEDLEKAVSGAAQAGAVREPEMVQAELTHVTRELGPKKEGWVGCQRQMQDLQGRYGVQESEKLMEKMVARKAELSGLESQLAALPALPESIGRLEEFLPRYQRAKSEIDLLGEEQAKLAVQLAEVSAQMREESAQDLERELREAEAAFTAELARGRALLRVEAAVNGVDAQSGDVLCGFRAEFTALVAQLSRGKYQEAAMEESLPTDFLRADGAAVPYGWLSAGTKDSFALALRLSMARHFLGTTDGFLLIDDPLVAMDPARQAVAAGLLKEFARRAQVVVFTCHPSHAELLGGNCIEI